ncbi:MAG: integration host factor subunit beta [Gammaproteobacteria bacterium]|nr:integration host factor subunit beta [Gammaproteobacteria bacterium]
MTKSELIDMIADDQGHLSFRDVEEATNCILNHMSEALADGERIEIRGFGAFSLHKREAKLGRNPRTGEQVSVPEKYVPHFKPGKILSDKVNAGLSAGSL